jgi:hypothetical protein
MTSPSRTLTWQQLSQCSTCHQTMFYPLFWGCNQHISCFKCIHNALQHGKQVKIDLNQYLGITTTYSVPCPVCAHVTNHGDQLLPPPRDWIRKFHQLRKDISNTMCPFCYDHCLLGDIVENYQHLHVCSKRPILCKLCNQFFPHDLFEDHMKKQCQKFTCSYTSCRDGKANMTLLTLRAHNMSHEQQNVAMKWAQEDFVKVLDALPKGTESERLQFSMLATSGIQAFLNSVRDVRTEL